MKEILFKHFFVLLQNEESWDKCRRQKIEVFLLVIK